MSDNMKRVTTWYYRTCIVRRHGEGIKYIDWLKEEAKRYEILGYETEIRDKYAGKRVALFVKPKGEHFNV